MTPLLKKQVDELFLHWFSEVETQKELRRELANIRNDPSQTIGCSSPTNLAFTGTSSNNRPQSPPIPPSSPTSTPRSPRRKTSNSFTKRSSQRSISLSTQDDDSISEHFYPGYAKDIIKPFYFPYGLPDEETRNVDKVVVSLKLLFRELDNNVAKVEDFKQVVDACDLPLYWKVPFYHFCGGKPNGSVTLTAVVTSYKKLVTQYHDEASQFFCLLVKKNKNYLEIDDFQILLKDIIHTHPGLQFLLEAPEFHSRYIVTVIARIFYVANSSWNSRLTLQELRRSNFLQVLNRLEEVEDINEIHDYFSYEHFYVIYCKFWELDTDHDMVINQQDVSHYANGSISDIMIDRLFSGCITRGTSFKEKQMTYVDFVWFLLSEVDKMTPTGIEYWFRCMDLDGDGVISMYEMQHFYDDQIRKMEELGMETLNFNDCLCQIYDMVNPKTPNTITLRDLKSCKMAPNFFDTFFNLEKWLEHEQKDPFQLSRDEGEEEQSAWDRYVLEEYELLVAEEGGMQSVDCEEEFEVDDETYEELLKPSYESGKWGIASTIGEKNGALTKKDLSSIYK